MCFYGKCKIKKNSGIICYVHFRFCKIFVSSRECKQYTFFSIHLAYQQFCVGFISENKAQARCSFNGLPFILNSHLFSIDARFQCTHVLMWKTQLNIHLRIDAPNDFLLRKLLQVIWYNSELPPKYNQLLIIDLLFINKLIF